MARSKGVYSVSVHYPEGESEKLKLRRKIGSAYVEFIMEYIMALPITGKEKNELYYKTINKIKNKVGVK